MPFKDAVNLIKEGLKNDSPIALLNMWNPKLNKIQWTDSSGETSTQNFEVHWVTITSITENHKTGEVMVEVSSWGGKATLNFSDVWENRDLTEILFPPGVIYFEPEVYSKQY